jgi:hypothetical protein
MQSRERNDSTQRYGRHLRICMTAPNRVTLDDTGSTGWMVIQVALILVPSTKEVEPPQTSIHAGVCTKEDYRIMRGCDSPR